MERQEAEYNMMNAFSSGMHRHTRPAAYADNTKQARNQRMQRPGTSGFSFSGEFPELLDQQPVMATDRRRSYTAAGSMTGDYQVLGSMVMERSPAPINRYGMQILPTVVSLVVLAVLLGTLWIFRLCELQTVAGRINKHQDYIAEISKLNSENASDIAKYTNDVNIRQEAVRLGMISSKGADVTYLTVPANAVLGPGVLSSSQSLASILGQ